MELLPVGKWSSFTSGWAGTAPAAGACESRPATDTVGWLVSVGGRSLGLPKSERGKKFERKWREKNSPELRCYN